MKNKTLISVIAVCLLGGLLLVAGQQEGAGIASTIDVREDTFGTCTGPSGNIVIVDCLSIDAKRSEGFDCSENELAENCGDGIDNDCDGDIDSADSECCTPDFVNDCDTTDGCGGIRDVGPLNGCDLTSDVACDVEIGDPACSDLLDNDCDGRVDKSSGNPDNSCKGQIGICAGGEDPGACIDDPVSVGGCITAGVINNRSSCKKSDGCLWDKNLCPEDAPPLINQ